MEDEEVVAERGVACLPLHFSSLFASEVVHDIVLDLEGAGGETTSMPAHRVVLVAGSTYFASLFSRAWEPATDVNVSGKECRRLRVPTEERLSNLQLFFAFLYGVEIELDLARAHPLLRLADFYGVDALMTQCIAFLERVLQLRR